MGFFESIGSIISEIGGTIAGAIKAVGTAILEIEGALFKGILNLASGIANFLNPNNKIEEEDYEKFSYTTEIKEIKPENYESVSEYIREGKEAMNNLTPEEKDEFENLDEAEKKRYKSNTISTIFQAFAEDMGLEEYIPYGAITGAAELKMEPKEFKKMIEDYKEGSIPTIDVEAYLDNKLDANDDVKMYNYLKEKLDKINENL